MHSSKGVQFERRHLPGLARQTKTFQGPNSKFQKSTASGISFFFLFNLYVLKSLELWSICGQFGSGFTKIQGFLFFLVQILQFCISARRSAVWTPSGSAPLGFSQPGRSSSSAAPLHHRRPDPPWEKPPRTKDHRLASASKTNFKLENVEMKNSFDQRWLWDEISHSTKINPAPGI